MVSLDGWFLSKGCLLETGCCNGDIMRIYVPFFLAGNTCSLNAHLLAGIGKKLCAGV